MNCPPSLGAATITLISAFPVIGKRVNGQTALSFKSIDLKTTHASFRIIFSPEITKEMDKIHEEFVLNKLDIGN